MTKIEYAFPIRRGIRKIGSVIPSLTDQNPCAQSRNPMDMIRQG
jgi:hypothetical protein